MEKLKVSRLDHFGIVSEVIDDLGLVEEVSALLKGYTTS
jgi:hypothetical protein